MNFFSNKVLTVALVSAVVFTIFSFKADQVSLGETKEVAYEFVDQDTNVQPVAFRTAVVRATRRAYRWAERQYVVTREVTPHYVREATQYIRTVWVAPENTGGTIAEVMHHKLSSLDK
ncbi:hypothetical protein HN014_07860 [Aquimarina sp. TRL1]|uniref:hypothetical protein n=1 Tax=Aquimarina sp. (strain TRL1) TaxID=2736252 RepID=UPI00158A3CD3|nr:hypothetical protein [Aquimarina sp. TRL1]QKX04833.1 hypothetical protein HN014_07860 [Aquimarina sp. TRL1]